MQRKFIVITFMLSFLVFVATESHAQGETYFYGMETKHDPNSHGLVSMILKEYKVMASTLTASTELEVTDSSLIIFQGIQITHLSVATLDFNSVQRNLSHSHRVTRTCN